MAVSRSRCAWFRRFIATIAATTATINSTARAMTPPRAAAWCGGAGGCAHRPVRPWASRTAEAMLASIPVPRVGLVHLIHIVQPAQIHPTRLLENAPRSAGGRATAVPVFASFVFVPRELTLGEHHKQPLGRLVRQPPRNLAIHPTATAPPPARPSTPTRQTSPTPPQWRTTDLDWPKRLECPGRPAAPADQYQGFGTAPTRSAVLVPGPRPTGVAVGDERVKSRGLTPKCRPGTRMRRSRPARPIHTPLAVTPLHG